MGGQAVTRVQADPGPVQTPTLDQQATLLASELDVSDALARQALIALLGRLNHETLRALRIERATLNHAERPPHGPVPYAGGHPR